MLSRISISPSWLELIVHPTASVRALFFHFFIPTDCSAPGRGQLYLLRARKDPEVPHFKRFLRHLSAPLLPSTCPVKWRRAALQPTAGRRKTFLFQLISFETGSHLVGTFGRPPTRMREGWPVKSRSANSGPRWQERSTAVQRRATACGAGISNLPARKARRYSTQFSSRPSRASAAATAARTHSHRLIGYKRSLCANGMAR